MAQMIGEAVGAEMERVDSLSKKRFSGSEGGWGAKLHVFLGEAAQWRGRAACRGQAGEGAGTLTVVTVPLFCEDLDSLVEEICSMLSTHDLPLPPGMGALADPF